MEFVSLEDTVRFGVVTTSPADSGVVQDADETPRWYVFEDKAHDYLLTDLFIPRSGNSNEFVGNYIGCFDASGVTGFESNKYYEVLASGEVDGIVGFSVVKSFVVDDVYDANVVRVSGIQAEPDPDLYFADIHYVKDANNTQDEYVVHWFKNSQIVPSADISDPALTVYNAADASTYISNQTLDYIGTKGLLRHNGGLIPSGEPIFIEASGLIDSNTRVWQKTVGLSLIDG